MTDAEVVSGTFSGDFKITTDHRTEMFRLYITVTDNFGGSTTSEPFLFMMDLYAPTATDEFDDGGYAIKEAIEKEYSRRKKKNRIFNDVSFEQTLDRLITRGLVVSGTDYLAADALYGLIGTLKIRPIKFSLFDKLQSMTYLYFKKGFTLRECYNTYFGTEITQNEKNVLRLSKNVGVSASEIIKCAENNISEIKSENDIMDKLYNDDETT